MEIGENIKNIRKIKRVKQKELAATLGVTASMISQYESGLRKPSAETILKIVEALGCNISDIVPDMCYHDSTGFYFFFDFDEEGNVSKGARKVTAGIEPKKYFERLAQKRSSGEKTNDALPELRGECRDAFLYGYNKGTEDSDRALLLQYFNKLNTTGKAEAIKRVGELTEIEKYKK
ncbi:MAG: helix-turn-helix transcriptional regulator [Firmicutes bacterium]|nr:helix-turn-helix transcriptional regulator [Bacillota bacterium]